MTLVASLIAVPYVCTLLLFGQQYNLEGAQVITREFEAYVVVWSGDNYVTAYRQHGY